MGRDKHFSFEKGLIGPFTPTMALIFVTPRYIKVDGKNGPILRRPKIGNCLIF